MTPNEHQTPRRRTSVVEKDVLKRPVKKSTKLTAKRRDSLSDPFCIYLDLLNVKSPPQTNVQNASVKQEVQAELPFLPFQPSLNGQASANSTMYDSDQCHKIHLKPRYYGRRKNQGNAVNRIRLEDSLYTTTPSTNSSEVVPFPFLSQTRPAPISTKITCLRPRSCDGVNLKMRITTRSASPMLMSDAVVGDGDNSNVSNNNIIPADHHIMPAVISPPSTPPPQSEFPMPLSPPNWLRHKEVEDDFDHEQGLQSVRKLLLPHLK